jgi:hypothetical protein
MHYSKIALLVSFTIPALFFPVFSWTLTSPDERIAVTLELNNSQPVYSIDLNGAAVVKTSRLGVQLNPDFEGGFTASGMDTSSFDETWEPVWDRFSSIRNNYRQLIVHMKENGSRGRNLNIIFRAYNDGVAFRYEFPDAGTCTMTGDRSQFVLTGDHTVWAYNGENDPIGPVKLNSRNTYNPPLVAQAGSSVYLAILEAAIFDFASFSLTRPADATVGFTLARSSVTTPIATSWRTIIIGDSPGALLESTLLPNLNPPCAINDPSWVEPGLCLWDWRIWGYKTSDGFTYDLNITSWLRLIDFAKDNNFRYLALDANWYGSESDPNSNPLTFNSDKDVKKAIEYGKERGVGIILYLNDVVRRTGRWSLQDVFSEWHKWGAAGIKYGFMDANGQDKVKVTRNIIKLCADNELLVNFHDGPIAPSGDRRTYPNKYAIEYCHAQADALKDFKPTCFVKAVFVNMLTGPLDMGNGWYALNSAKNDRVRVFTDIQSTVVSETARIFCTFSGVSMIPDAPEEYAKKADLFDFLKNMPMHWDETRILNGEIGRVITTARRKGDEWFVGSVINEQGGTVAINLDFLNDETKYFATLYEDADNTHYINNKESYRVREDTLTKNDVVQAKMAPGGGHCIWFRPDPSTAARTTSSRRKTDGFRCSIVGRTVAFTFPGSAPSSITISTLRGSVIRHLPVSGGAALWDGRNNTGAQVRNGSYLVRFSGSGIHGSRTINLIR